MKVTVVSVVYNDSEGLSRTLESACGLVAADIETVVVDGDSTDDTVECIRSFESRITRWISEPDSGIFHAMDRGLALATGDWVVFMNAGDCFASPTVVREMNLESFSEYALVYGSKSQEGRRVNPYPVRRALHAGMTFACHQAMFFNRRLLGAALHYHRDYFIYGDFELVLRLYRQGFRFAERDVVVADFEGGGVSSRVSWGKRREKYRALLDHVGWLGVLNGVWSRLVRRW